MKKRKKKVSVQFPCYNEQESLHELFQRCVDVANNMPNYDFNFLFVDDNSTDSTPIIINDFCLKDNRFGGIRLARNCGAHAACSAGLMYVKGDCVIAMSADLQDPPEIIPKLIEKWEEGNDVVWAERRDFKRKSFFSQISGRLYWFIMKKFVFSETHKEGADFFLIDKKVAEVINNISEKNRSVLSLINYVGFKHTSIPYEKEERKHGNSKWKISHKIKFTLDSIIGNSHMPIRIISLSGIILFVCSLVYAFKVFYNFFYGEPIEGWSSVILLILIIGSFTFVMMGVIGEYIWRILDEVRDRPYFVIEKEINIEL